jgi:membrane protease YdiL (CAAX protease family)
MTNGSNNVPPAVDNTLPSPREQLIEVGIVLFLMAPSAFSHLFPGWQASLSFTLASFSVVTHQLGLMAVIWLLLRRNHEPLRTIGWTGRRVWADIGLGILLLIPLRLVGSALGAMLFLLGFSPSRTMPNFWLPHGAPQIVLALILVTVVAVTEEVIDRGYLIRRLSAVTGSLPAAVGLSTAVFSLMHAYQGPGGMVGAAYTGLGFALIYVWRRSLTAPIVMHFVLDFAAIVLPAL